jgi:Protein of unknown function (DUF3617)
MTKSLYLASASLFLSSALISSAAGSSGPIFRAGAWEITRQMTGGPRKQGPQTDQYCFTEAQLKADPAAPLKTQPKPREGQKGPSCNMGPATMDNGRASISTSCKGPMGSMKANISGTYTATSFTMNGKMKMGFMSAKMSSAGRYLGACATK